MARGGLSNRLLGRIVLPDEKYEQDSNPNMPAYWQLNPNLSGERFGIIEAAWTEDGTTKVTCRGPNGDIQDFWLKMLILTERISL